MIPGFFHPLRPPHAYVPATIGRAGTRSAQQIIPFLLDTGASRTILQPHDVTRALRTDWSSVLTQMTRFTRIEGFAGGTEAGLILTTIWFADDAGPSVTLDVDVAIPTDTDVVRGLPSILGWDVLRHLDVHLNRHERLVSLTPVNL